MTADRISEIRVWTMGIMGSLLVITAFAVPFSLVGGNYWAAFYTGLAIIGVSILIILAFLTNAKTWKAAHDERSTSLEHRAMSVTWHTVMYFLLFAAFADWQGWLSFKQTLIMFVLLTAGLPGMLTLFLELKTGSKNAE